MDVNLLERVVESSPVIVLIAIGACVVLWRKLERKDDMLMTLQRETLTALGGVTQAVRDLRDALDKRS